MFIRFVLLGESEMANKVFRTSVNANEAIKAANEFDVGLMDRFIIR